MGVLVFAAKAVPIASAGAPSLYFFRPLPHPYYIIYIIIV